jgi:hypothetical protein
MDDRFPRGRKVKRAARHLAEHGGRNRGHARGRVLAVWTDLMGYCADELTDGFFPEDEIDSLPDLSPREVLASMCVFDADRGPILEFDAEKCGWQVRNYGDYQPLKKDIDDQRKRDRDRKQRVKTALSNNLPRGIHSGLPWDSRDGKSDSRVPVPSRPDPLPERAEHEDQKQPSAEPSAPVENSEESDDWGATSEKKMRQDCLAVAAQNDRVLLKLAHTVLDERDAGTLPDADVKDTLKDRAARAGLAYDSTTVRVGLDQAEAQRQRQSPGDAALRVAQEVLRAFGGPMPVRVFQAAVFGRVAETWPAESFAAWRDEVVSILWRPDWYRIDRAERVGAVFAGPPGKQTVAEYVWKGGQ